ncbi:hypothetical protein [Desulfonatronospira sp.]|uniref:hypothetical protein n=1 Tax=Desulfonatronospira sp. TaxID=1962951 RepID=UPI0025C5C39B|nr:hypothetical protein [Desulfonatronospira sp.]
MDTEKHNYLKKKPSVVDESGDFIFRFVLSSNEKQPLYSDPLIEMVREQICNLLNVVVMTSGNKEVNIDGFKLLNNLDCVYKLFDRKKGAETSGERR